VQITQKLIKAYSDCQLIAFAVNRLGYLGKPKAFAFGCQLIAFAVNRLGYLRKPKAFAFGCQLIAFAVNRLGYLGKPKAFQKNASHPFGFFNTR
jgi:hypothetical protein